MFPPLDGRSDLPLRDRAERGDDRRLSLAEDQRDVLSLALSQDSAAPSAGAVVREGQRQVAMQDEDCVAVLVVEAQVSAVAETRRRAGVIGPGVAHELKLHLTRLALDRTEDLMLRPQLASRSSSEHTGTRSVSRTTPVGVRNVVSKSWYRPT